MGRRRELQDLLETLLGSENVYFQPPGSLQMAYPAITYTLDDEETKFADNKPYSRTKRWKVTVIDRNPDSLIPDRVGALVMCLFDRRYVANQLNHTVYNLYF